jgi:hypothetical protein
MSETRDLQVTSWTKYLTRMSVPYSGWPGSWGIGSVPNTRLRLPAASGRASCRS